MQERELNCATIGVANRTDISGRATADEINRGLQTGKERSFWRIACLTFLGSLTVAALFVAVAPLPVRADEDKDSRQEREDNNRGIRAEIAALQAQVASVQATVSALQDQVATLKTANTKSAE
jgi:septal ring factor EnvC (AmiA/AmiB activator)